jgi:hypothetical protein
MDDADDLVAQLVAIEERLRDRAYERLRSAADGEDGALSDERRVQQARRAVERAIRALRADARE